MNTEMEQGVETPDFVDPFSRYLSITVGHQEKGGDYDHKLSASINAHNPTQLMQDKQQKEQGGRGQNEDS